MPDYRRYYIQNCLIFITCVTKDRAPLLQGAENLGILWETIREVNLLHPFHLLAFVILPDHFHWIMRMPDVQPDFSIVLHSVKRNFTYNLKKAKGITASLHAWQARYWDHVIRSDLDLERHIDYIHWNPVKHAYVEDPGEWAQSSFQDWVQKGYYPADWGGRGAPDIIHGLEME